MILKLELEKTFRKEKNSHLYGGRNGLFDTVYF